MTEAVHAVAVLVRTLDLPPKLVKDQEELLCRFRVAVDEPASSRLWSTAVATAGSSGKGRFAIRCACSIVSVRGGALPDK
ncbi:hypothetical protein ABT052_30870 [Streptomyces sp. NPDC002766]|uniref:hypothetical protein n=1 Tax=Streptomyces sp. NPDC002766 TaxID=3154429 RepID=UPI00332B347F